MSGRRRNEERRGGLRISLAGVGVAVAVLVIGGVAAAILFSSLGGDDGDAGAGAGGGTALSSDPNQLAADLQGFWASAFQKESRTYEQVGISPFAAARPGGCKRLARNSVSFYCAADRTIYLKGKFLDAVGADDGELAQAFVVAHLFGHHVQEVLGITAKVIAQELDDPGESTLLARQLELEADCLAGYGLAGVAGADAPHAEAFADALDAIAAAAEPRVKARPGAINPETWQLEVPSDRLHWLDRGLGVTDVGACDTFSGAVTEGAPR